MSSTNDDQPQSKLEDHSGFNRRAYTRVTIDLPVSVHTADKTIDGHTRDLSFQGLFVRCSESLPVGSTAQATISSPDAGAFDPLLVDVTVVAARDDGMALHIDIIHEADSFQHLKHFILYNAADPDKARAEINQRLGTD